MTLPALGAMLAPQDWGEPEALRGLVDAAEACRELGWPVLVPEHAQRPDYVPSSLATVAWLLGAVPGLHAGAITIAAARDPLSVVRDLEVLATAAALAGGRTRLGLVSGYDPADLPGQRFDRRYRALDEHVEAAGPPDRRHWSVLVGAATERGLARAARADGWLAGTHQAPAALAALVTRFRAAGGGAVVVMRRWVDAATPEALERVALPSGARTPRDVLIGGGAGQARARLAELAEAGADEVVLGPVADGPAVRRLTAAVAG